MGGVERRRESGVIKEVRGRDSVDAFECVVTL